HRDALATAKPGWDERERIYRPDLPVLAGKLEGQVNGDQDANDGEHDGRRVEDRAAAATQFFLFSVSQLWHGPCNLSHRTSTLAQLFVNKCGKLDADDRYHQGYGNPRGNPPPGQPCAVSLLGRGSW